MRLKTFPIFFSVIPVMSTVGFAAAISVQNVQILGSDGVQAPPVSVSEVEWHVKSGDYRYIDDVEVTFTATEAQDDSCVHDVAHEEAGVLG